LYLVVERNVVSCIVLCKAALLESEQEQMQALLEQERSKTVAALGAQLQVPLSFFPPSLSACLFGWRACTLAFFVLVV